LNDNPEYRIVISADQSTSLGAVPYKLADLINQPAGEKNLMLGCFQLVATLKSQELSHLR